MVPTVRGAVRRGRGGRAARPHPPHQVQGQPRPGGSRWTVCSTATTHLLNDRISLDCSSSIYYYSKIIARDFYSCCVGITLHWNLFDILKFSCALFFLIMLHSIIQSASKFYSDTCFPCDLWLVASSNYQAFFDVCFPRGFYGLLCWNCSFLKQLILIIFALVSLAVKVLFSSTFSRTKSIFFLANHLRSN